MYKLFFKVAISISLIYSCNNGDGDNKIINKVQVRLSFDKYIHDSDEDGWLIKYPINQKIDVLFKGLEKTLTFESTYNEIENQIYEIPVGIYDIDIIVHDSINDLSNVFYFNGRRKEFNIIENEQIIELESYSEFRLLLLDTAYVKKYIEYFDFQTKTQTPDYFEDQGYYYLYSKYQRLPNTHCFDYTIIPNYSSGEFCPDQNDAVIIYLNESGTLFWKVGYIDNIKNIRYCTCFARCPQGIINCE